LNEVKKEIEKFTTGNRLKRPDNWIIATNIDLSGAIDNGAYDKIKKLVNEFDENINIDIWGGMKIISFINTNIDIARAYGHFLTPGHVISKLYENLEKTNKSIQNYINHIIYRQFEELNYTKLDQAGATGDQRQKIYHLFRDLPISNNTLNDDSFIMDCLISASSNVQKTSTWRTYGNAWKEWSKDPRKSRVILIKGGPGQGKSTAGQYFSQIQRAAFILSEEYKNLKPKDIEYAKELKNEALRFGFWPTVPRIPLFVELKDYAKWYNSKLEFDPKNIVEYLIYQLKRRTSIDISAESIHEAFQLSSWFINFDGLDEVPNDVKDQIADEITSFTNELIPSLDADFLILATTRPQGYSGQFDNLQSADVTLLPLTPEIALQCATPLLEYNRSAEEIESSLSILKSAMDSDQVKELMTTPLQSHIMAVVVRDGGRPPEKRWTLFNNFYSVMKKRESLKDFPDLKIQSLLREREQLLKSIHDRLGICLHSKAEKSLGAEAALDRAEFQELARQTVSKHIDFNVESFVTTLMEATTERLVFVNTPDNSDTVRFDIRQLQEFFAAEFIYTAVSNEELRRRIETICGDAHWREVIHFLLSALISHQKLGELSVVIAILQSLDDDSHNNVLRSYKKNSGRGALLTLRLLSEGVLEEDRQIRQPFAKSLSPIWGMIEYEAIKQIASVNKEQSKHWLLNNLIETMTEMDYSEHITAGYLASVIVPNNHPRLDEVMQRIINAPEYYLNATYDLHYEDERANNLSIGGCQLWFLNFTFNNLFMEKQDNNILFDHILSFTSKNKKTIINNLDKLDISEDEKYLLKVLTMSEPMHMINTKQMSEEKENQYSLVRIELFEKNWHTNPENDLVEHRVIDDKNHNNTFKLLISALNFYFSSNISNLKNFVGKVIDNKYDTRVIPVFLKAMFPIKIDHSSFKEEINLLNEASPEELSKILQTKGNGHFEVTNAPCILKIDDSEFNAEKWRNFVRDFPEVAISLAFNHYLNKASIQQAKLQNREDFYNPLIKTILEHPVYLMRYFLKWGEIFEIYPESKNELLDALSKLTPPKENNYMRDEGRGPYFEIDLLKHKTLIINLSYSLFYVTSYSGTHPNSHVVMTLDNYNVEFLKQFSLDDKKLIIIIRDINEDTLLRACALSCFLALSSSNKINHSSNFFDNDLDSIFISLVNDETIEILSKGLHVFLSNIQNLDERLENLLGSFSLKAKNNYHVRMLMQSIYRRWRERSSAPVESGQHLDNWLKYIFI